MEGAEALHGRLDRYAYGGPRFEFSEADVDQARAAGVLLELGHAPLVLNRALYRELTKSAVARTVDELRTRVASQAQERTAARRSDSAARERSPAEQLEVEHRALAREFARRAHGVNLELGSALLDQLAVVDPADVSVARFFGLRAAGRRYPELPRDHTARTIAANGLRLVLEQHRNTETPTLKSGKPGKTKVSYAEPEQAVAWLWKFVDGATTAGELYGRVLVVFAAEHYAFQLALPTSQRRSSVLPRSHGDRARKAFDKVAKSILPATHGQLARAIEREARQHRTRIAELATQAAAAGEGGEDVIDDGLETSEDPDAIADPT